MEKRYSIRVVKKEIKDVDVIFPTKITEEEIEEWADEIKDYLSEDVSYSPEITRERIGGKAMEVEMQLHSEHTDYELVEIEEIKK